MSTLSKLATTVLVVKNGKLSMIVLDFDNRDFLMVIIGGEQMSSGAELRGFDDVLRNLEVHLGDTKVKRATSRCLRRRKRDSRRVQRCSAGLQR